MSKDLTKKAVELLLSGATLVSDPCPYCKGVRVMKNGSALCVSCGKEAKEERVESVLKKTEKSGDIIDNLDQKLHDLTVELQSEKDLGKQKQILQTINEIIAIKEKLGAR
ncbi:MAG TPA: Sjogren's syndrome/scleroderma autoantigen 1 family protein [Candidatus Nitrosotalea sp.]|nr:Sjogren's syndrome/scleroderma autoantigen 1 family protein [Candidatus Nitrosotalea sp.]